MLYKRCFNSKQFIFLIIISIGLAYIVWNSPLVCDDLYYAAYGFSSISDIFWFALTYGNGRLFGNMLIHFLLQSSSIRVIVQTSLIVSLWCLTYKVIHRGEKDYLILGIFLFLTINPTIFREDYLWSSAVANYIPGILCMIGSLLIFQSEEKNKNIALLIISISGQLFVEHTSVINVLFSLSVLIFCLKTNAEKYKVTSALVWFLGTVIGIAIMFFIPKVFYVHNEWENYQKININTIQELFISIIANGMQISGIILKNVFAFILLSSLLMKTSIPKQLKIILAIFPIYGFVVGYVVDEKWTATLCCFLNLLALLVYLAAVIFSIVLSKELKNKYESLFYIAMCVISVLPLLIVYPIGARCILHAYVYLVLGILSLFINNPHLIDERFYKQVTICSVVCSFILVSGLTIHFHSIGAMDENRLNYAQSMVDEGANEIIVPKTSSPYVKENDDWSYGQIFYQKEKMDIEFEFISYSDWYKLTNNQE